VADAVETYGIDDWGRGHFCISDAGHVMVTPPDQAGHAILPASLSFRDPADRKFTALALTCEPPAPIYNASDTDWAKERRRLAKQRIRIRELCPEYITEKIRSD